MPNFIRILHLPNSWLFLGGIVLVGMLVRIPFFNNGLHTDEVIYSFGAQLLLEGDLPYRDLWDHKPPGIYFTYAAAFAIFGEGAHAVRIVASLFMAGSIVVVFQLADHLFGKRVAYVAASAMALFSGSQIIQASAANVDTFMVLPLVSSLFIALLAWERRSWQLALVAGALGGIAFDFKATAAFTLLAIPAYWLWSLKVEKALDFRRAVVMLSAVAGGFVVVQVIVILFFVANGAFEDLIAQAFLINFIYVGIAANTGTIDIFVIGLFRAFVALMPLWVAAGIVSVIALRTREKQYIFVSIAIFCSLAGALLSLRGFGQYFIAGLPFLSVATGAVLISAYDKRKSRLVAWLPVTKIVVLVTILSLSFLLSFGAELTYFLARPPSPIDNRVKLISEYVQTNSASDDYIFVWGSEPNIYSDSERASSTKYISVWLAAREESVREEIIAELETKIPQLIITVDSLESFPELEEFITRRYTEKTQIPIFDPISVQNVIKDWLASGTKALYVERSTPTTIYELTN